MSHQEEFSALEARIAFQEDAIDKLSDELANQAKEIDMLKRMVKLLNEQIKEAPLGSAPEANVPPPHY